MVTGIEMRMCFTIRDAIIVIAREDVVAGFSPPSLSPCSSFDTCMEATAVKDGSHVADLIIRSLWIFQGQMITMLSSCLNDPSDFGEILPADW